MKLTFKDIKRIAKEVEQRNIDAARRTLEHKQWRLDQIAWEAYMESRHGDWGCRD
jgi:hypothetical protein